MTDERPDSSPPHQPPDPVREPRPPDQAEEREEKHRERWELLDNLQALLEPAMTVLGLVFLVLLLVDYANTELGPLGRVRIDQALQVIWGVFVIDFAVRLWVAPAKLAFLRANWLTIISLALPFLRPLRAFRAIRAVRSLSLVRLLGGMNRGMRVIRRITRGAQLAYVGLLTLVVMLAGAVGAYFFEQGVADAQIRTLGDAIWWSSALVTTINNEKYVVSPEARTIAILMRIYAVSIFGYITASIATYLIGSAVSGEGEALESENTALRAEIASLREEIRAVRRSLERDDNAQDHLQE
ncbi:MAG TPA: ion transporter [Thermomicrobiales bacterium]|nr:ion transporter [Thermomicrobiales bacterium]